jgi:hypothetical protein
MIKWLENYFAKRRARRTIRMMVERTPTIATAKLEEMLAVDEETPLLKGILYVLKGLEEYAVEQTIARRSDDRARTYDAGATAALADAQERIIEIVQEGNRNKRKSV